MSTHSRVTQCPVPNGALLMRYVGQGDTYTDCYECEIDRDVTIDAFIFAFYTTWLFRLERLVLSVFLRRSIVDTDITAMLNGDTAKFAVWRVEARGESEMLLREEGLATRSWFTLEALSQGRSRLMFGSAVVAGDAPLPLVVRLTVPLHVFYSKALLASARRSLRKQS